MPRIIRHFHYKYIENFLDKNDFDIIVKIIEKYNNEKLDISPIQNRFNIEITEPIISNILKKYTDKIKKIIQNQYIYLAKNFPIEYRKYIIGSFMKKHCDTIIYKIPQYECVLTMHNSSDSYTIMNDNMKISTTENSLLIVRANGIPHEVTQLQQGERKILKFIFTSTDEFYSI
jgi:chitinase